MIEVLGWRRANGRLGIRNHVAVIAADAASDAACAKIAAAVPGVALVPSSYSLAEDECEGADVLRSRILAGIGSNPNVAAAILVGTDDALVRQVAQAIAASGAPVEAFRPGDAESGVRVARRLLADAAALRRQKAPLTEVWIACKCDESDATTGSAACPAIGAVYDALIPAGGFGVFGETPELVAAAEAVAARAVSDAVAAKWFAARESFAARMCAHPEIAPAHPQPTPGNVAGGIPTAEAKAFSSLAKIGQTCRYVDVLAPAAMPGQGPGLYYMDTSSELASIALMAASGFVIAVLASGFASTVADPIVPVLQVNANAATIAAAGEAIDLDLAALEAGRIGLSQARDLLLDLLARTADGALAASEGHRSERAGSVMARATQTS
jgi:(2R)-sulfolactate sulfo-lyase subunit beta